MGIWVAYRTDGFANFYSALLACTLPLGIRSAFIPRPVTMTPPEVRTALFLLDLCFRSPVGQIDSSFGFGGTQTLFQAPEKSFVVTVNQYWFANRFHESHEVFIFVIVYFIPLLSSSWLIRQLCLQRVRNQKTILRYAFQWARYSGSPLLYQ
jgi:hypothetical protein